MKSTAVLSLLLLCSPAVPAIEEIVSPLSAGICKPISQSKFDKWDFHQAVRALGNPPGAVTMATYDMLRSTWEQKGYSRRNGRLHYLMSELMKNGNTTDMNTWMLIRANSTWLNHHCAYDRKLFFTHLLKPYEQENPRELPHRLNWLRELDFIESFHTPHLMGIMTAQQGIPATLIERVNPVTRSYYTPAEVNRLWSDPAAHAPYLMWHGSDFARHSLRFLLHDSSVIYESARRSGLTCWDYTWGRDLPEPIALGLQLMQKRSQGILPTAEELTAIRKAAEGLPPEMQGFIVRNMLAADPTCMPWKKLDDPGAALTEMPDCTAVLMPQWNDALLGQSEGIEQDLAALEKLVLQEQDADMLSTLVLFTLADGSRIRKDHEFKQEIPTQGHYRYSSTFDVEVSENGIDVLIDEKGPRFARNDEEMRRRCRDLNVALHRCALRLALLERDGRTEELKQHSAALAKLCNRLRIWPLLLNELALRKLSPECTVQLLHHCQGGDNILRSFINLASGGSATNVYSWANLLTTRRDEDNKPAPEPELLAAQLRDYLINHGMMPHTQEQLEDVQKRFLELDDRFPRKGIAESLLLVGRMNDTLYTPDIETNRISGESSRRGYFLIRHALKKGDLPTAEKLLAAMTATPKHYRHTGTRLAAALVARAKGDEAAAREHERLGITQAAMHQFSYYTFHWADAHRLLLEHGFTRESERLFLLVPERDLIFTRPALTLKLAEQRRFRSAAFSAEMSLARFCSNAAPISGMGTQADLITRRLQADVYHALALLRQGNKEAAETLLNTAVPQLERMPEAAALLAPALLTCADIPADTRQSYRERFLRGAASQPAALAALQQVPHADLPTVDESDEADVLQKLREPEGIKPPESPYYTWHLQKQGDTDAETELDERTATRITIDARITSTQYEQKGLSPWVELETETGRKFKVKFDDLQADDLANIIDWKERNNIRTWVYRKTTPYSQSAPFDARLDRMLQGKSGGKHLRNGVDVSDGRQAEFTRTDGTYTKIYVNQLDDDAISYIEQFPRKEKMAPHLHSSLPEAEADAVRRNVTLRIFMLGKRGGPEEADFQKELAQSGVNFQEYNSLLVCYKDDKGEWDAAGKAALQLLNATPEFYHTPGENHTDGGFSMDVSRPHGNQPSRPRVYLFKYGRDASKDAGYKELINAIRAGKREEAERIMTARPELLKMHSPYHGMTSALQAAILNKRPRMVETMLKLGANPNDRNCDGHTMLYTAVCQNSPEIVRILMANGARHDIPSLDLMGRGMLPLFACTNKPEMIKTLVEGGIDPNLRNEQGENLLHSMLTGNMLLKAEQFMVTARAAIAAGLDINATDDMGESVLYGIAKCAADNYTWEPKRVPPLLEAMKELIDLGADPEESSGGFPPLLDRLKKVYTPTVNTEFCPEVEQILREYRRKPQN